MRILIALAVASAATGCNESKSSKSSPPAAEVARAPEAEVLPPRPRSPKVKHPGTLGSSSLDDWNTAPPPLDTRVTGVVTRDPSASELERCKYTGWSYAGCWTVYPAQGWIWTKFECEHIVDDDQRTIVCDNYASHLAIDGNPTDHARAFEILESGCDAGAKATCVSLAELVMWDDPERAKGYAAKACAGDPNTNPIWCRDPSLVPPHRFAVTITDVHGLDGITTATKCSLGVIDGGESCRVRFACGDRALYGGVSGTAPCTSTAHGIVGGEAMTSPEDDDPAIEFDAGAQTVHVHDVASATAPAFDIRGTLSPL